MHIDPVDTLVSDLPFVTPSAGTNFSAAISQTFTSQQNAQSMMVHLRAKNGPVLLEMVANVFGVNDSRLVVMTGREVDVDLATLMMGYGELANDRASESNVSIISSLTTPTLYQPPSEDASICEPVFLKMVGDAVRTESEAILASPSHTTFATMLAKVMKGRQVADLVDHDSTASGSAYGSGDSGCEYEDDELANTDGHGCTSEEGRGFTPC